MYLLCMQNTVPVCCYTKKAPCFCWPYICSGWYILHNTQNDYKFFHESFWDISIFLPNVLLDITLTLSGRSVNILTKLGSSTVLEYCWVWNPWGFHTLNNIINDIFIKFLLTFIFILQCKIYFSLFNIFLIF